MFLLLRYSFEYILKFLENILSWIDSFPNISPNTHTQKTLTEHTQRHIYIEKSIALFT